MKKQNRALKIVFYTLLATFGLLIVSILTPPMFYPEIFRRASILVFYIFTPTALILGIVLVILTIRAKVKAYQKLYLILTGSSPVVFLIAVLLHNFLDYFAETTAGLAGTIIGIISASFFLIAVFACPIAFIVGVVGSIVFFRRNKK